MGIITAYPDKTPASDGDKYLTVAEDGSTRLTTLDTMRDGVLTPGSVDSDTLAQSAVTPEKMALTKETDANGWTVYDYGSWKEYYKKVTFNQNVGTSTSPLGISSTSLPVGVDNISQVNVTYAERVEGYAGDVNIAYEGSSNRNSLNFTARAFTSRTYSGDITVKMVDA